MGLAGGVLIAMGLGENTGMISELHQKWFLKRGVDPNTAINMATYSGKRGTSGLVELDEEGDILVFPFIRKGREVGAKYRGPNKQFWQKKDGRKQFFNADILEEEALHNGTEALIITEGEIDAISVASCGNPFVVSVPDGAPPPRDSDGKLIAVPEGTSDIDPDTDTKYSYIMADWEFFRKIKRIIIATDSDEAGQRLASELVRRLDPVRCSFVVYPKDCKDFNDVLVKHGQQAVRDVIAHAKPYPVDGLFRASDFPDEGPITTYKTGWAAVDEHLRPYLGAFMVVGGFPGHGKSTWTMQLAANMARMHRWNIAIASFEMKVNPYVTNALMGAYLGCHVDEAKPNQMERARGFLEKHFIFVAPNYKDVDREHDIDWLLDRMTKAVIRDGVHMVLIDPWNEIEHKRTGDESQTEYIGRAIRKLKAFAMQYNVLVCVVVHPTKSSSSMDSEDLGLYNLADSSHWANKADLGVIVGRIGDPEHDTLTGIYIKKIRYQPDAGSIGDATLDFNKVTRLFRE